MDRSHPITVEQMYGGEEHSDDDIGAVLDRSRNPRPSTSLYQTVAALGIGPAHTILDIGARDARHSLALVEQLGCRAIAVEPVDANLRDGTERIAAHAQGHLVDLRHGVIEDIPVADDSVDLVFARDMLGHVADLGPAFAECRRVLRSGGAMVVYETFATPRLEPWEAAELCADLATIPERLDGDDFEGAVAAAGLTVQTRDIVGSEWREAWEEDGTRFTSRQLLHAARMIRARDELLAELGEIDYRVELANALWGVYQLIGKLEPRVYVLDVR